MILKDNKLFELPQLMAGSFRGLDRLTIEILKIWSKI